MNISEPFIRRPIATTLLMAAIAFVGIAAYPFLPVAPLPQVDFPTIQVSATWQGAKVQFAMQEPRVPVYVAASGPNMLRMGGRVGDGVIVGCGIGQEGVDFALSHIEAGAIETGRRLADVDVWFLVYASVAESDAADSQSRHPGLGPTDAPCGICPADAVQLAASA